MELLLVAAAAIGIYIYYRKRKTQTAARPSEELVQLLRGEPSSQSSTQNQQSTQRTHSTENQRLTEPRSYEDAFIASSANGEFKLHYGHFEGGLSLARSGKTVWRKEWGGPFQSAVANNGVVLMDYNKPVSPSPLGSEILLLNTDGDVILRDAFKANVLNIGMNSAEELAWVTTAIADNEDGHQLFIYDTEDVRRLLKADLPSRGVDTVRRDRDNLYVTILGVECHYSIIKGRLLNPDEVRWNLETYSLNENAWGAASAAKHRINRLDELSEAQIEETLELLEQWVDQAEHPDANASVYRRRGELLEELGQEEDALANYESALRLDEKVGCKRKRNRLKKKLSKS